MIPAAGMTECDREGIRGIRRFGKFLESKYYLNHLLNLRLGCPPIPNQ
jgi:hypothetical protein